jgi:hypothetical protein
MTSPRRQSIDAARSRATAGVIRDAVLSILELFIPRPNTSRLDEPHVSTVRNPEFSLH